MKKAFPYFLPLSIFALALASCLFVTRDRPSPSPVTSVAPVTQNRTTMQPQRTREPDHSPLTPTTADIEEKKSEPDLFRSSFNRAAAEEDSEKLVALITEYTRKNPAEAAKFAMSLPKGDPRMIALREVARTWAEAAPHDALRWAATLSDEESERRAARDFICFQVGNKDPKAALDLVQATATNTEALLPSFAVQWARRDLAAAQTWTLGQPKSPIRDTILRGVLVEVAKTNPVNAATLVSREMNPGVLQEETSLDVAVEWAKVDPAGAMKWISQFPAEIRPRAEENLRKSSANTILQLSEMIKHQFPH